MSWTEPMAETLAKLWRDGVSATRCAAEINQLHKSEITRNGVIGKVHRLGLSHNADTPPKPRAVRRLRQFPRARAPKRIKLRRPDEPPTSPHPFPLIKELPPDHSDCAVTFADLGEQHCRWPIGDPASVEFRFCGAQPLTERPYCARHCRMAYQPLEQRREQAA